jgi:hypothetical protein
MRNLMGGEIFKLVVDKLLLLMLLVGVVEQGKKNWSCGPFGSWGSGSLCRHIEDQVMR